MASEFSTVMNTSMHVQCRHIEKLDFAMINEKLASRPTETAPTCLKCQSDLDCWICLSCCQCYCSNPAEEFTHINHHCSSVVGHYISFSVADGTCWCELCSTFVMSGEFEDFYARFKEVTKIKPVEDPSSLGIRFAEVTNLDEECPSGKFSIGEEAEADFGAQNAQYYRTLTECVSNRTHRMMLAGVILFLVIAMVIILAMHKTKIVDPNSDTNAATGKPNIVFVMADDLGWNAIGHNNYNPYLFTPFLDSLARQGVVLTNYYSQELCTPARASLLTGRLPIHMGRQYGVVYKGTEDGLDASQTLLPAVLAAAANYKSYLVGKWHLGVYLQSLLPTARGFSEFVGYTGGMEYYWSKSPYEVPDYRDMMISDGDCYSRYNYTDYSTYSTFLYRDKAVRAILNHDYEKQPMFLFFASQAVHDPYVDNGAYLTGVPVEYLGQTVYDEITGSIVGNTFQQYAMSLYLLDQAVSSLYDALITAGQLNNTYIVFASDNGGCTSCGGRNGPLRGRKGTLFEGGTKVDAFIYSPLLASPIVNRTYSGLFHVSDWFPTLLSLIGVEYQPKADQSIDGVDLSAAIKSAGTTTTTTTPNNKREYVLYNLYSNVEGMNLNISTNGTFAIRDSRYKLMHGYSGEESGWFPENIAQENDDVSSAGDCWPVSRDSNFTYYLFDLLNDPYETTNLYADPAYDAKKTALYAEVESYLGSVVFQPSAVVPEVNPFTYFASHDYFYQPWEFPDPSSTSTLPQLCTPETIFSE